MSSKIVPVNDPKSLQVRDPSTKVLLVYQGTNRDSPLTVYGEFEASDANHLTLKNAIVISKALEVKEERTEDIVDMLETAKQTFGLEKTRTFDYSSPGNYNVFLIKPKKLDD